MSSKQLAWTVANGSLVTFRIAGETIVGYLCGMDDFHWMIITAGLDKHLVHKGSASLITLSDEKTYDNEEKKEALENIIGPYRERVKRDFFGQEAAKEGGAA